MRTLCPELGVVSICPDCVKSLLGLMTADERLFGQKMQSSVICAACDPSCGGQELNVWDVRMARIIHQPQLSRYQLYPPLLQTSPTKYLEIRNNTNIIRTKLAGSGCKYLLCLNIVPFYIPNTQSSNALIFWEILSFSLLLVLLLCAWWYISLVQDFLLDIDRTAVSHNSHISEPTIFLTACKHFACYCRTPDSGDNCDHVTGDIRGHQGSGGSQRKHSRLSCLNTAQPTRSVLVPLLVPPPTNAVSRPGWLMLILTHFYPPFCQTLWGQKTICLFLINSNMRHGSGSINLASNVNRDPGNSAKNASRNREQIGISNIQNKRTMQNIYLEPHDWIMLKFLCLILIFF